MAFSRDSCPIAGSNSNSVATLRSTSNVTNVNGSLTITIDISPKATFGGSILVDIYDAKTDKKADTVTISFNGGSTTASQAVSNLTPNYPYYFSIKSASCSK